jgi:1-acyl-sn-glycerol-3-phosphate acyltransferase
LDDVSRLPGTRTFGPAANASPDHLEAVTRACVDDLLSAFGLGDTSRWRLPLELVSRIPARRLARQISVYDWIVGEWGLAAGGAWALEQMSRDAQVGGGENVPREGPLLLVSNHPGLADAVALFAATPRTDLRVVAAERPLLEALPNTKRHLLTVPETSPGRLGLVRAATRHLQRGGAVLTFPGGRIEPDPVVLPGAVEALDRWSSSVDLFARLTPGLTIVPAVVSGVISPAALRNPLTRLRRRRRDREWLAATLQMLMPALRDVTVRVEFGSPVRAGLGAGDAVRAEARRLLKRRGAR